MQTTCNYIIPKGWWCSRDLYHTGPCAARPRWWNFKDRWRFRKIV